MRSRAERIAAVFMIAFCFSLPRVAAAELEEAETVVRLHWKGAAQLQDEEGKTFLEILRSPVTARLRNHVGDRLAVAFSQWATAKQEGRPAPPPAISALFDALFQSETVVEIRRPAAQSWVATVAARLPQAQHSEKTKNLRKLLAELSGNEPDQTTVEDFAGWESQLGNGDKRVRVFRAGDWSVFEMSSGKAGTASPFLTRLKKETRPAAELDESMLSAAFRLAELWRMAGHEARDTGSWFEFLVKGRDDNLRTEGRFRLAEATTIPHGAWRIPTNAVRDPLISFTAIQGIEPWVRKQSFFQKAGLEEAPNQLFLWANVPDIIYQIYAAVPMQEPSNVLKQIESTIVPEVSSNLLAAGVGQIVQPTNSAGLYWLGLPYLVPFVKPGAPAERNFLVGGIFPLAQSPYTNPPPRELLAQFEGREDLVYYDWELTQPRLFQLRELTPVLSLVTTLTIIPTNSVVYQWLDYVQPKLGETVTEISVQSPRELAFVRKAPIGLTAVEILAFAHWLNSPAFPAVDTDLGFRPLEKVRRRQPAK